MYLCLKEQDWGRVKSERHLRLALITEADIHTHIHTNVWSVGGKLSLTVNIDVESVPNYNPLQIISLIYKYDMEQKLIGQRIGSLLQRLHSQ